MNGALMDYAGDFDPDLRLEQLDHRLLACYAREIMLANHIHDRGVLVQVALTYGPAAQTAVACDEWMGSSPIYNARNRKLLNMHGDNVQTALKCLQLDIGAPHNFLNFHYEVVSDVEGYFWTTTCGPYNHVRRMTGADPAMETQICHHMEDPTFDATVMAVNPRMRCRPVFRPPHDAVPAEGPCRWRVAIDHDIGLVEDNPTLAVVRNSLAADFAFADITPSGEGMLDYSGDFKRDFVLEDLEHAVLARQCKEFALDVHLLNRACYTSIADRWGQDVIVPMTIEQWRAMAPITVHRLRKTLGIRGTDMSAVLKVLQLNPFLPPEYLKMRYQLIDDHSARVWIEDCAALHEPLARGLVSLLTHHPDSPGFNAMASAVNPLVRCARISSADIRGAAAAWELTVDASIPAATPSEYAELVAGEDLRELDNTAYQYRYGEDS
jgi:hypothetical protein